MLYGWGAAPDQRIYKSNEVVGVNYTGVPVARRAASLRTPIENEVRRSTVYTNV